MASIASAFWDFTALPQFKMTFSTDIRWRGIVLMYVYSIDVATVSSVLGLSERSLSRWYKLFRTTGNVLKDEPRAKTSRWPSHICAFVREYVEAHPCFYFEELRSELRSSYGDSICSSDSTICRALRFDLKLTRKVLTKRARESLPRERREYIARLAPFYNGPDQLVFVDETSKDGR
jgi:transposase